MPVGTLILLWGYLVYKLGTLWHSNEDYAFGWFVPALCIALFWERWKRNPYRSPSLPGTGTFLLFGLLSLCLLLGALFIEIIPNWRFGAWLFALATVGISFIILYFIGGGKWCRFFAFPLIFLMIAVPWPSRFEEPLISTLSKLNAAVSTAAANELGTPAVRHGVLIETIAGFVGVDNACSGIRSLQSSVMIALFLGELVSFSFLRRVLLLMGAVGVAMICNVIRTTYLVRLADLNGLESVNLHHDQAGFSILAFTLMGQLLLAWLIRPRRKRQETFTSGEEFSLDQDEELSSLDQTLDSGKKNILDRSGEDGSKLPELVKNRFITLALAALVFWVGLIEIVIYLWFRPSEIQTARESSWQLNMPTLAREYHELAPNENIHKMLSYDETRQAEWRDNNGLVWQLYFFRWLPPENRYRAAVTMAQARSHAPDVCLKNAGMILQTNYGTQIWNVNGVQLEIGVESFLSQGRDFDVFACYWEPDSKLIPQKTPGTISAIRFILQSITSHERGWREKRVLKMGVWGKDSDEAARIAFRDYLSTMISR